MLSYITSAKFDSWKGTTEYLMLNWQDQVRLYESLVDEDSYFSENQKKILLENAVAPVKPMRLVKDQADQMSTHTGKDLDYDQYAGLLLSAATNYDMQFASTSSKSTRKVYNTELDSSDFAMDSPSEVTEDTDYDIDASATTLLANMTNRGNANSDSYLPSEDYSSLSAEERDL